MMTMNRISLLLFLLNHVLFIGGFFIFSMPSQCILLLTFLLYGASMFSLSAGYHRFWSHRTYMTGNALKVFFLFFGSSACITSAKTWCKFHRLHHRHMDTGKDPMNINDGFFHAHIGWYFKDSCPSGKEFDFPDLHNDQLLRWQDEYFLYIFIASGYLLPGFLGAFCGEVLAGLFWTGIVRMIVSQHVFSFIYSLCHMVGFQPYSIQCSARNSTIVSLLSFGEGYQNFHHEFPNDYRLGIRPFEYDPTKWILKFLSYTGLTYELNTISNVEILKTRIMLKQYKLNQLKAQLDYGPEEDQLPEESWSSIDKRVAQGAKLVIIDGLVHDVSDFISQHPGGAKILLQRIGKDSTLAFNGAVYRHTKAARNLAAIMRVAKLPKSEIHSRMEADNMISNEGIHF